MTVESESEQKVSPMMAQWHACKGIAENAVLLFRMGDFYEAFYDDAVLLARELELTLTKRQDIPMAGVPCHTCEGYIDKLVAKGFRVAVAEQTEDPKKCKGLVKREVVRVVTPGTVVNSSLLSDKSNNFFVSITQVGSLYGLAVLDLTTAEFFIIEFDNETDLMNELYRLRPAEVLTSKRFKSKYSHSFAELQQSFNFLLNEHEDWHFEHQVTYDFLVAHLGVHNLDGYGLKGVVAGINAGGALLQYLQETLCLSLDHIKDVHTYSVSQYMSLDRTSQRNLELTESLHEGNKQNTLFQVMDKTCTPMGGRLLRHWVKQPLLSTDLIHARQDAVEMFVKNTPALEHISRLLEQVRDMERLIMKVSSGYASPRDLVSLRASFEPIPQMRSLLQSLTGSSAMVDEELNLLNPLPEMTQLIARAIVEEPPARVNDGNIFNDGFNKELDDLREISRNGKNWIARYQANLRETTGIKTLKVGYNRMFGYYIEVSKGQADKMPDTFQRRQTLVNAERFISPELKDYESKVLTAEERIASIESELFANLRHEVSKYANTVLHVAQSLARLDCIQSLAALARQHGYVRPIVDSSDLITIKDGRHPVIEAANGSEKFVPNDTLLDDEKNRLLLITGPNMAGKSTYIRQVALITIMAQMGSFVPAKEAHIGVIDKVFTRIGASDDLARGQSTFMVEMTETANILNNATSRSLVILDEIGRGTSTYDGISIAWSVAEFLLTAEGQRAKTLFATHYWELTKLEEKVPGAINYNVAVHESEDHIVFLRKIVKGGTDKSYGIHVARLAGLPTAVLGRAKEILEHLEENANRKGVFEPSQPKRTPKRRKPKPENDHMQMTFFG
ncbi:MAG: DNA mismatch repair protein MutS [Chlamydiales bacterium]|nr:DNA mismatch repair protein MutS [Chlamydiales bacterium]